MKTILTPLFFILCTLNLFSQDLYNVDSVRTIYLDFFDPAWETTLEYYYDNDMDDRVLATLTINGEVYDSVGVRFKGNSSLNFTNTGDKRPFNISIDYVINQDLWGYTTLKLSNMFKDPSFIREVLSFEILRNYMPASQANFLVVYTDSIQRGLYANTESVNKDFVENHFGSDYNSFFKCDPASFGGPPPPPPPGCIVIPGMATALIKAGNDTACYKNYYENKSDSEIAWYQLMNMILELNNNPSNVNQVLDIDRSLWMLVFNNIFANMDSYTGSGHNFYTYENSYGVFNNIIWDLNENFGVFSQGMNLGELINLHPFYNKNDTLRPLINKLFSIDDYSKRYMAHFRTYIDELLTSDAMKTRAVELQTLIDTYVLNDPKKLFPYSDFQVSLDQNIGIIPGINVLMDNRYTFLQTQPDVLHNAPTLTNIQQSVSSPTFIDSVWITAQVSNVTQVCLQYKTEEYAPFGKYEMYDDGNHNDGSSGDGIYGAMIPDFEPTTVVNYYVYAENAEAGIFSPARAEYEFYTYVIAGEIINAGDVVINEIMASNTNTQADESGEFDDWVELYNTSDHNILLYGLYLSDKVDNKLKWAFPDTTINSNDFFIVWTDSDPEQAGVHTSFKLSASGEAVILSNYFGDVIDSVSFLQQSTDTTYGRFPNGTGSFIFMPPTFATTNSEFDNSIESINYSDHIKIYPNPASDNLCIEYSSTLQDSNKNIEVYNLVMQKLIEQPFNTKLNKVIIPLGDLSNGVYILRIGNFADKFIINK